MIANKQHSPLLWYIITILSCNKESFNGSKALHKIVCSWDLILQKLTIRWLEFFFVLWHNAQASNASTTSMPTISSSMQGFCKGVHSHPTCLSWWRKLTTNYSKPWLIVLSSQVIAHQPPQKLCSWYYFLVGGQYHFLNQSQQTLVQLGGRPWELHVCNMLLE